MDSYFLFVMKSFPARAVCEIDMENVIPDDIVAGLGQTQGPVLLGHKHNLKNRFELKRTLGEGTYGKVKLAEERSTGEQVSCKFFFIL